MVSPINENAAAVAIQVSSSDVNPVAPSGTASKLRDYVIKNNYSGFIQFCQYLHIGPGILSFGGDVFRL